MVKMSIADQIKNLEKHRLVLIRELLDIRRMVRGTYSETFCRCGKSNCWCATAPKGHPCHRITWTKNARPGTKTIPAEDIAWIKEMTANYRNLRELRTELRHLEQTFNSLLNDLEEEIISRTRKLKKHLGNPAS